LEGGVAAGVQTGREIELVEGRWYTFKKTHRCINSSYQVLHFLKTARVWDTRTFSRSIFRCVPQIGNAVNQRLLLRLNIRNDSKGTIRRQTTLPKELLTAISDDLKI
jgi:hypothetical protein